MKNFVAVRTKYYKSSKGKSLEWHIRRDNKNKNTASVYDEHSHNNVHREMRSRASCRAEYKELNGRKIRSDFNEIFEHVLVFSREKFEHLEEKYKHKGDSFVKQKICDLIEKYAQEVQNKYGFEPLRYDLHLDEGRYDKETGEFKRNIHAHLCFYNYDFKARKSYLESMERHTNGELERPPKKPEFVPLNPIKKKVKDKDGNLTVNPVFSEFQDLGGEIFRKAGFRRGISKTVTNADHLDRDDYIQKVQDDKVNSLKESFKNLKRDISGWIKSIGSVIFIAEKKAQNIAENLDNLVEKAPETAPQFEEIVNAVEDKLEPSEPEKVTPKRKRRRRKR